MLEVLGVSIIILIPLGLLFILFVEGILPKWSALNELYKDLEAIVPLEQQWEDFKNRMRGQLSENSRSLELQFALLASHDPQRAVELCISLMRDQKSLARMSALLLEIEAAPYLRGFLKPFRYLLSNAELDDPFNDALSDFQKHVNTILIRRKTKEGSVGLRYSWQQNVLLTLSSA